jgi:uncharacterized protein (TIGR00251 family)
VVTHGAYRHIARPVFATKCKAVCILLNARTMQFKVKVIPKSSENKIIELDNQSDSLDAIKFKIKITVPPEKGKANQKVIELLSKKFKVSKSAVQIIRGFTIPEKTIKINL